MVIEARALLFDMDGLMVDSEPLWLAVEADFARERGGEWTPELAHACIGKGLANTLRTMRDVMRLDIDEARDTETIVSMFLQRSGTLALKTGCTELLDAAQGVVPMAVASSSARRLVHGVLEGLGVAKRFDVIVAREDAVSPKPAPDLFLEAARRVGQAPAGCVVLEDSLAGVTAGHAAGMTVIAVPERDTPGMDRVATVIVRDLHEARAQLVFLR